MTMATLVTSAGNIEVRLMPEHAPTTVANFVDLATGRREWRDPRDGQKKTEALYPGTIFHRVIPDFMIQGGDPEGTGGGGPGYQIVEPPPPDFEYEKGVVAMAKSALEDPGTAGSQFFVVTVDGAPLDPDYAVVGKVTKGLDVVDLIGVAPVGPDEQPVEPIVMRSVEVEDS